MSYRRKRVYNHEDYIEDILRNELSYLTDVDRYHIDGPQFIRSLDKIITTAIPILFGIGLGIIVVDGIKTRVKR